MWKLFSTGICLILITCTFARNLDSDPRGILPPKPQKTSADRIRDHGYPADSHYVETPDGYVLNLFRIPYSPKLNNEFVQKPVVFLQHGMFCCSDVFLLNGPDNSIAFLFADAGYDVWLGNARGNVYSRNNTKISEKKSKFWQFSWHEIGVIDIAKSIDYVLSVTGETKLHYVGHSQGTTAFFALTSSLPEYNNKIKTAHMLAPPIFMGNVTDYGLTTLAKYVGVPGIKSELAQNQEFLSSNSVVQRLLDTTCGGNPKFPKYCKMLFLLWSGNDQSNTNATLLPLLAETHPAGISTNQIIHYAQLHVSEKFRRFDFGKWRNLMYYNQQQPPDYPLERITANMYLYYGLADSSANATDVARLPDLLPNIRLFHEIPDPTWTHTDFLFAMQVKDVINDPVIQHCDNYENESRR